MGASKPVAFPRGLSGSYGNGPALGTGVRRDQSAGAKRLQQGIERGKRQLGQGARDALGVSGRAMLRALAAGEPVPPAMADWARESLRRQKPECVRALEGRLTDTPRWVLGEVLARSADLEAAWARVEAHIRQAIEESPAPGVADAGGLLDPIPGGGTRRPDDCRGERGRDGTRSQGGAPGEWGGALSRPHESAGQRKSGKTTKGRPFFAPLWCRPRGRPPTAEARIWRPNTIAWSSGWGRRKRWSPWRTVFW